MPQELTLDQARDLYEREIKRLQGELSILSNQRRTEESIIASLKDEKEELSKILQGLKESIANTEEDHKRIKKSFEETQKNVTEALAKRDKASADKMTLSDKKLEEAKVLEERALTARNQLVGLAQDIQKTINKSVHIISDSARDIDLELQEYSKLRDPKAEIPIGKNKS